MPKLAAFLRAINTGGHRVKMDRLKKLFEDLEFTDVFTYIASGNVIFESRSKNTEALETKIEKHLHKLLGYEVATFIRTIPELCEAADRSTSLKEDFRGRIFVAFLKEKISADKKREILTFRSATDDFFAYDKNLFWLCDTPMMESSFSSALLEKILGRAVTLRNMNTVKKMVAKFGDT